MLTLEGLNQCHGQSQTLWDIGLEVPEGALVCLMGRNGVGKTTLLKCVMGLLPIRSGVIRFDGEDLGHRPAERRAPLGMGYVPCQSARNFDHLSALNFDQVSGGYCGA